MRGIVISPLEITGPNSLTFNPNMGMKLRNYILYWDRIDIPINNIIGFDTDIETDFLKSAGVVQQSLVRTNGSGEVTKLYVDAQLKAFDYNNSRDVGCWSLGQENLSLVLPEEISMKARGLEVNLYDRLPIPTKLASFEDILQFKWKRYDELLAFRELMDEFYLEILNTSDSHRALEVKVNKVKKSIREIEQTMNESRISKMRKGVKVSIDIPSALKGAGLGTLFTNVVDVDSALAAFIGGASNLFNLEMQDILKPNSIPENLKDYAYLYYAKQGYTI